MHFVFADEVNQSLISSARRLPAWPLHQNQRFLKRTEVLVFPSNAVDIDWA